MSLDLKRLETFFSTRFGTGLLFVVWALFITNLWLPRNWGFYGGDDWDLTYATFESARKCIADYHQWPGFNPYLAFGSDMDANPQSAHASIFFLPILLFGTFYGYKVSVLLALLLGLTGMKKLLESLQVNAFQATLLSMLFCSATYFSRHIMEAGHSNFLNFYLIPFLFLFLDQFRNKGKLWHGFVSTLILTQFISGGAPLVFIVAAFMMLAWSLALIMARTESFRCLLNNSVILLFGFALSLWKIIPVLGFWSQNPRLVVDDSGINPLIFLDALADFRTDTRTPHDWHEFSIGIGLLIPLLILFYRQHIPHFRIALGFSLFFAWLTMGNVPPYINPWYLIHHFVPIFDGLRAPSRFAFILLFILTVGFALVIKNENSNKLIVLILMSITLSNGLSFNAISRNLVFSKRIEHLPYNPVAIPEVTRSHKKDLFFGLLENKLILDAYEPQALPEVKDTLDRICVGAQIERFSPNRIDLNMTDTTASLNIRYNKNWNAGNALVSDENGRLKIASKQKEVSLVYANPLAKTGRIASSVSLLLALLTLGILPKRKGPNAR